MPARSASRPATPRSCAPAPTASARRAAIAAAMRRGSCRAPACRPTRSSSCRPATAPPSARCSPGSTATSTSSCRAAARASSPASRRRRGCRSSRISKASATSMSTPPPTSTWRSASCSTPRCAAPASAAPPRRCSSTARCAATHLAAARRRRCSRPAARCAATPPRGRPTRASRRQPRRIGRAEYLDAIIAVRVVDGLDAAIDHIETYGSHHTDAIVTDGRGGGGALPRRGRFGDRPAQRLDPVRRRRRVRLRRRDRHRHRPHARPRPGRRRAAHLLQVPGPRRRPDAAVRVARSDPLCLPESGITRLPPHPPGLRIGLFGGSFNPPHAGHRHVEPLRAEAPPARPRLVARHARQPAEGARRACRRSPSAWRRRGRSPAIRASR